VPAEVVDPLVQKVMGAPDDMLLTVSDVFKYELKHTPHSFSSLVCDNCGEMVVEGYARILGEKKVCIPCYEGLTGAKE